MALRFHFLSLLLACMPAHSHVGERDVGAIDAFRLPANTTPVSEDCRDPDNVRIDGMARWACRLAIASESSGTSGTDPEDKP